MKLGMMQPYFFPYIGYFDLIYNTDRWVVFDTAQYSRHSWINRNRILKPHGGWQYVILPLQKSPQRTPINEMVVHSEIDWRTRVKGQLQHYAKRAPYFNEVMALVERCFSVEESNLARLNGTILKLVCEHIGIVKDLEYFSDMNLNIGEIQEPGDWALNTAQALNATVYVNPPGGEEIFDKSKFDDVDIELVIRNCPQMRYHCRGYQFEPDLSILDVLMWNDPEAVGDHLAAHRIP